MVRRSCQLPRVNHASPATDGGEPRPPCSSTFAATLPPPGSIHSTATTKASSTDVAPTRSAAGGEAAVAADARATARITEVGMVSLLYLQAWRRRARPSVHPLAHASGRVRASSCASSLYSHFIDTAGLSSTDGSGSVAEQRVSTMPILRGRRPAGSAGSITGQAFLGSSDLQSLSRVSRLRQARGARSRHTMQKPRCGWCNSPHKPNAAARPRRNRGELR